MAKKRERGGVYKRGAIYWISFYDQHGKRRLESAETGDKRLAESLLTERRRQVKADEYDAADAREGARAKLAARTFKDFWSEWLATRTDVKTIDDDRAIGENWILPFFGAMPLAQVTTGNLVDFLNHLRTATSARGLPLSKNTIVNISARLVTFFADQTQHGNIVRSPYDGLRKSQKPKKPTRHELAATKRVFTEDEVMELLFNEDIPEDRRMIYALQYYTGARFGEAAGFTWADYETHHKPLGMLRITKQYAGQPLKGSRGQAGTPRTAPVHPVLASLLADWKLNGFARLYGRAPKAGDYIVPTRNMRPRTVNYMETALRGDCERVDIEATSQTHAFRRSFKTHAVASGAPEVWIERIVHNANGGVAAAYLADDWNAMCAAVRCIRVARPQLARVIAFPVAASGHASPPSTATATATTTENGPISHAVGAVGQIDHDSRSRESASYLRLHAPSTSHEGPQDSDERAHAAQTVTHVAAQHSASDTSAQLEGLRQLLSLASSDAQRDALLAAITSLESKKGGA